MIIEAVTRSVEHETRARVLSTVSEQGPITASQLGRRLGLTSAAVRRHLDLLAEQGAVVEREPSPAGARGRGRPAREWVVAEAGHASLSSDYDHLAAQALRYLHDAVGPEAVSSFARFRVADLEARYAAELACVAADPFARAEALVSALTRDGFAASARPIGASGPVGIQLCQGHCPVQHVAAEFPQLCQAETDAFSRLLGVHVQRLSTLARGQHVCTTFVPIPSAHTAKGPTP
ncbi:MAG: helix-turn-helix domain-containing protein [Candidatus Phosphoribacter sp.]|nr:helix-turn-helix domain-containing protein [Actinomycetales bacterium]